MHIEGSCSCGAVRFSLESRAPYPFLRCYCTICRKTTGGGGYAINISGEAHTLKVHGKEHVKVYQAQLRDGEKSARSEHQRHFCAVCGSHLWGFHPAWPDLVHPVASVVDTPLPRPPEHVHMMLGSKATWLDVEGTHHDLQFDEYPDMSLAEWHERHGVYEREPQPRRATR